MPKLPSKCFACRIKPSWDNAGRLGLVYGTIIVPGGQQWSIVQWVDEEDPTMFKTAGLEI